MDSLDGADEGEAEDCSGGGEEDAGELRAGDPSDAVAIEVECGGQRGECDDENWLGSADRVHETHGADAYRTIARDDGDEIESLIRNDDETGAAMEYASEHMERSRTDHEEDHGDEE